MATDTSLQLNLGSLRSAMSLTLHTHHASRIWHGRAASEGKPGIVGLNGFIAIANKIKRGAEQDDPYSDWWMLRLEEKLTQTKDSLQALREQEDELERDEVIRDALGDHIFDHYVDAKRSEWDEYRTQVSDWEVERYLDEF